MNDNTCASCGRKLNTRETRARSRTTRQRSATRGHRPWRDFRVDASPPRGFAPLFRIHG